MRRILGDRLTIAVDARPLAQRKDGIHVYTKKLLERLVRHPHRWCLYGCQNIFKQFDNVVCRDVSAPRSLNAFVKFGHWARDDDADLFWSPRHHLPHGLGNIPAIVTVHDLVWKDCPEVMPYNRWLLERALFPRAVGQAVRVMCVSRATRNALAAHFPSTLEKSEVIPLASSFSTGSSLEDPKRPYLLFVGTREPRKNIKRLLHGFARIASDFSGGLMLACADGWLDFNLTEEIETLGLTDRIYFEHPEGDADLAALYRGALAVVLPSLYEGFGLPIVEAMTFGKPIVTSSVSSMPEVAGDAALLVDPTSVESIAEGLRSIIFDKKLRVRLAENSRRRSSIFSWDRTAQLTLAEMESTIE